MNHLPLNAESLPYIWKEVVRQAGPLLYSELARVRLPVLVGENLLALRFEVQHELSRQYCSAPASVARIEEVLLKTTGIRCRVRIDTYNVEDHTQKEVVSPLNNCFFKTEQTLTHDELRFRSKAEIAIYDELTTRRLLFFPNAAAVIGGGNKTEKKEPDFLICQSGKWGILEVMGSAWHTPANAVKDHDRARLFKEFGILCIEFFDAGECYNNPAAIVDKFLEVLAIH